MSSGIEFDRALISPEAPQCFFPQVARLWEGMDGPPVGFMRHNVPIVAAREMLNSLGLNPPLDLPVTSGNHLDHGQLHIPVVERIKARSQQALPGLETFGYAYPTAGSSGALETLLSRLQPKRLAIIAGEYGGYVRHAVSLGIPVRRYPELADAGKPSQDELWLISNPSAREGNMIEEAKWLSFVDAGHDIVLDTAYLGLTDNGKIDVSASNIRGVVTSPSKELGLFHYRATGVTYTREPIPHLDENARNFKDVEALIRTLVARETYGFHELPQRYRSHQDEICRMLSLVLKTKIEPSHSLLLAYTIEPLPSEYNNYKRDKGYRFGLGPILEQILYAEANGDG